MRVVFDTNILVLSQLGKPATDIMRAATKGTPSVTLAFFYSPAMCVFRSKVTTCFGPKFPLLGLMPKRVVRNCRNGSDAG